MIEHLPSWINTLFIACWIWSIIFFYLSNGKPIIMTVLIIIWSLLQSVLAYNAFYQDNLAVAPRFILVLLPSTVLIIWSLLPQRRSRILKDRDISISTFLHVLRIPVEIVLWQLFIYKMIPQLMTFEGRNFDIFAGISALIVGFLFVKKKLNKRILLIWNYVGLALILFILSNGLLSAELPFQQFAFDQPNRALNYFPFILLPAVIVPMVLWTHLTDIIKLRSELN